MPRSAALVVLFVSLVAPAFGSEPSPVPVLLDDFEDVSGWNGYPADGVFLTVGSGEGYAGRALRLDVDFHGGGGYAVVRKSIPVDLPPNYAFRFRVRGEMPVNHLEFKLLDASGENVWWFVHRDIAFDGEWTTFTIKKRRITFAWGPAGGGEAGHVAALEFAVTAGSGGRGTVWIDDLELTPLPLPSDPPPEPRAGASSAAAAHPAAAAVDGDAATAWMPAEDDTAWAFTLDLVEEREFGGLVLEWLPGRPCAAYAVEARSADGSWRTLLSVDGANGGRDHLYLPQSDERIVRIVPRGGADAPAPALAAIAVMSVSWSETRTAFFEAVAADAPRGTFPRGMSGEQVFWTVTGADRDPFDILIGEDGAVEFGGIGGCTVEPFLHDGAGLITWADVAVTHALLDGDLPIPVITWTAEDGLSLEITVFPVGEPGSSGAGIRWRLANQGTRTFAGSLALAVRPYQVNPPAQFLNTAGGTAEIRTLAASETGILVNDALAVRVYPAGEAAGAAPFAGGDVVAEHLLRGVLPEERSVFDSFGAASGAIRFDRNLGPGEEAAVYAWAGREEWAAAASLAAEERGPAAWMDAALAEARATWRARLDRLEIAVPAEAEPIFATLRSQAGYVLVNRAGPAIQPGPRSYARSWIRDGALTSSAMLRLGHPEVARDFLAWYAPHQYANGKAPCVVDRRGADPVPEHDSTGEFLFLIAEIHRYTGDRGVLEEHYPAVRKAVAYLDSLRHERRTAEYEDPGKRHFFGLLPESISHEGYSAKPMHSYWDDFWAVRGFRDAVYIARTLDEEADERAFDAIRAEFEVDFAASIRAAMAHHEIEYVPGCADLGDFDATSTTIALEPAEAAALAPAGAIERTFDRYDAFFAERAAGAPWDAFTPYEMRSIGAYVRLGRRDRAQELLRFFLAHRLPEAWNQWPEVVYRATRTPRFLGDLPHTWVGSDYVRSVLDMLLYAERDTGRLVVAEGIPVAWLDGAGVRVRNLPSPWGPVGYAIRREGGAILVTLDAGARIPPAGIVVRPPLDRPARRITVNGVDVAPAAEFTVTSLPAEARIVP